MYLRIISSLPTNETHAQKSKQKKVQHKQHPFLQNQNKIKQNKTPFDVIISI
jgi:Holliday junction resolvase-like predicted endonuclease